MKRIFFLFVMNFLYAYNLQCQTFPGQGGLPFPPTGFVGITESTASVAGVGIIGGCVQIDNVTLDLNHTWTGDIAVMLIAPDGTFLELFSQNGNAGNDLQVTEFRDDAPINVVNGAPPYNGQFNPEGSQNTTILNPYPNSNPAGTFTFANTFNGINADGDWTLFLNDFVGGDLGVLNEWSITFTANGNELTVDAGDDQTICIGESITLTANAPGATMYMWDTGENTPSINVSPSTTTTYIVTANNGACSGTDEVEVEVLPAPDAFPTSFTACDLGNGTGDFDLTVDDNTINGGTGLDVNWYSDSGGSNPISNPGNYISGETTVYANVGEAPCLSEVVPIELSLTDGPDYAQLTFNADPLTNCGPLDVEFSFDQPGSSDYNVTVEVNPISGPSFTEFWDITSGFVIYPVDQTTTFDILTLTDAVTGCVTNIPPGTFFIQIEIEEAPEIFINLPDPICIGESIDLNDYVTVIGANGYTFHDDSPASPANEIPSSEVSPSTSTIYYILASGLTPDCNAEEPIEIIVNPLQTVDLLMGEICEHEVLNLNTLFASSILDGEWSGDGVDNNFFDPTGLSGTVELNFTADEDCILPASTDVEIIPSINITLDETELCENGTVIDLVTLQDPNYPDGEWDGPGVFSNLFNPAGLDGEIEISFEGNYQCALPSFTTITVNPIIIPELGTLDYCVNDALYNLAFLEDINYTGGTWSGEGVTNNEFDPTGLSGEILLSYEITDDCAEIAETYINVIELQTPILDNTYWCTSIGFLNLEEIADPQYIDGVWSGEGVFNNFFDPTDLSGDIGITFQSSAYCTNEVSFVITLIDAAAPTLTSTDICASETNFDLSVLQDPIFNVGYWSGQGVVGTNQFNAQGLTGTVELEFISTDGCVENATTSVNINAVYSPILSDTLICENATLLNLTSLQDPNIVSGVWSGQGVVINEFFLENLSGVVQLTFDPNDYCAAVASTTVTIQNISIPLLKDSILCEDGSEFDLSLLNDDNFINGLWFGTGIIADTFYPQNLSGDYILTFVSTDFCTDTASTVIKVNEIVSVNNISVVCDLPTSTYTISFDIVGGDINSYLVNNINSTSQYISPPFPSETPYSFSINDGNNCNVVALTGTKNCTCATSSGSMDIPNEPALICKDDVFIAIHNGDENLDVDTFLYVLHDNAGLSLGNIFGISDKPEFSFPANGELGKTYYVSAIAGNSLAQFVDTNDPCLSIAQGSPVQFYEIKYNALPSASICKTECIDYSLNLQGKAPFIIYTEIKKSSFSFFDTLISTTSTFDFSICPGDLNLPSGEYEFVITKVADADCETTIPASNVSTFITVNPERINNINDDICKGESKVVAGKIYDENLLSGTEIILSSNTFCDSIINVNLNLLLPSEIALNKQLCEGETLVINGTVYNENNLTGTELFQKAAANGCDSIVNVRLEYTSVLTNEIKNELCSGKSLTVNGTIYDETNANGTEILIGGSNGGCDSIINVALTFLPNSNNSIVQTLCRDESITVNGKTFDINNSSGNELLINAATNGCDSLITVNLSFYPIAESEIKQTICKDENLLIAGSTFDVNNPEGVITIQSINGCDSTINVALSFYNDAIGQQQEFVCENDSIIFKGVVFNIDNAEGEFLLQNSTKNGCDSILLYKLNFYPVIYDTVVYQIYVGDSLDIDGNILSINNQLIEYILFNEGENDCDIRRVLKAEIIKKDVNIVFPNILNPSSNNGNDKFEVYTTEDFLPLEFSIYDRWGNKVHHSKSISGVIESWDGKMNGDYLLPGVYIYHISYQNADGEAKSVVGDVTIVR